MTSRIADIQRVACAVVVGIGLAAAACHGPLSADARALMRATALGNVDEVRELIGAGVDPNTVAPRQGTAMALAAGAGHREIVILLLGAGADPNVASENGHTPLREAAFAGNDVIVTDLLASGADVNAGRPEGQWTALHAAARRGHRSVVIRLLEAGADPLARDSAGATPRDLATRFEYHEIVNILLAAESLPGNP